MAVLKTPAPNTPTGKRALTPTEKRTLVLARDVMATVLDALRQAQKAGMRTAITTRQSKNGKVIVLGFAITGFDVMAENGKILIDGRAITDAFEWNDLRDVMAESEKE